VLSPTTEVLPGLLLFAVLVLAHEVGFRVARRAGAGADEGERSETSTLQGGMLALLGLLLAFTFAMASQRFDNRKQLVLDEANAIGTAYLRATAVPGGEEVAELLRRYVDVRLEGAASARNPEDLRRAVAESERLHDAMWSRAAALARANPDPLRALLLVAMNEVIDLHEKRLTAMRNRVPPIILVLLLGVSVITMASLGHAAGASGGRSLSTAFTFAMLVTFVIMVVVDLDRPERGLIRVSQQSLQTLRDGLHRGER
jgi:hypothetical protein